MSPKVSIRHPTPGVGLVTICRRDKHNAIDPETNEALADAFARLDRDDSVRCLVITGEGDQAFCAGADIPTLLPVLRQGIIDDDDDPQFAGITHRSPTVWPIIAAINGVAFGGGLELALACDLRLASTRGRFGLPEITVGVLAGGGGCTRLPRTIPAALAAEMILTGQSIDAGRALEVGLVSEVMAPEALLPRAIAMAGRIATRAPAALKASTALLRRPRYHDLEDALVAERLAFGQVLLGPDAAEGIRAFAEKREPNYQGR